VPDKELPVFYKNAKLLALVSLYEGFGLPVLEAMACGTPVVSSNGGSLPEVAGEAAVMIDPYDINNIVRGLRMVLEDRSLRKDLTRKGLKQAEKFSWEKTAKETYEVYRKVMQEE